MKRSSARDTNKTNIIKNKIQNHLSVFFDMTLYIIIEIIVNKNTPVITKSKLNTCEPYNIK